MQRHDCCVIFCSKSTRVVLFHCHVDIFDSILVHLAFTCCWVIMCVFIWLSANQHSTVSCVLDHIWHCCVVNLIIYICVFHYSYNVLECTTSPLFGVQGKYWADRQHRREEREFISFSDCPSFSLIFPPLLWHLHQHLNWRLLSKWLQVLVDYLGKAKAKEILLIFHTMNEKSICVRFWLALWSNKSNQTVTLSILNKDYAM